MFYQTLCSLNYHLRHMLMMFRQFIKCRINDFYIFSFDGFLDICYFLWSFVNQKYDDVNLRIVDFNGFGHFF